MDNLIETAQAGYKQEADDLQHLTEFRILLASLTEVKKAVNDAKATISQAVSAIPSEVTIKDPVRVVKTPDMAQVVQAVKDIKLETKETDLSSVVTALETVSTKLDSLPKTFPKLPTELKVSNLGDLQVKLEDILLSLRAQVESPPTINVAAPEVNVDVPKLDLSPILKELQSVKTTIAEAPLPTPTDLTPLMLAQQETTKAIDSIRFPVPNFITDPLIRYKTADLDDSSTPAYYGMIANNGDWVIMKQDTVAGTIRYAAGSGSYPTNWTNRASLTYGYLYEAVNG